MRVLFLYPDVGTTLPPDYHHGVGILIALLKQAGHQAELIYIHEEIERDDLISRARKYDPGLIAFSSVTNQFKRASRYASWLKEELDIPIMFGGAHATMGRESAIEEKSIDILCVGEGEGAMMDLVETLEVGGDIHRIENLWVKQAGSVIKNPLRKLMEDLDSLPFADRESFNFENILEAQNGKCSMMSGRGCPYGCTFCANKGLSQLYRGKGKFVRWRSVEKILEEMRRLLSRYKVARWDFPDDIFTLKRSWLEEYCELYPKEFSIPYEISVRVEHVDRQVLEMLKGAHCDLIRVGVESGNERVRNDIMNRTMDQERIIQTFDDAKAVGIKTLSFNCLGVPGETEKEALETLEFNKRLSPDHMQVTVFNPYPGTKLYEICKERGALTDELVDGYLLPDPVIDLPEFPAHKIQEMHRRFIRLRDITTTRMRFKRELSGITPYYDFVESLDQAEVDTPEPLFVGEDHIWIGEDARRALRIHPPSRVRFEVLIPQAAELRFSMAMHPEVFDRGGGDGVIFTVRIGKSARKLKEVFRKKLDPKGVKEDRGWHDDAIDLAPWSGKNVVIEFETGTVDPNNFEHNTVGLGFPIIVEKR